MAKQNLKAVIINPEALEAASIRKTRILFDFWWEAEMKKQKEEAAVPDEKKNIET